MKRFVLSICVAAGVASLGSFADDAKHPCHPKVEARHQARQALRACLDAWAKDAKPGDSDPSDDCAAKTSAFVQAAKDVKACHAEHHKK